MLFIRKFRAFFYKEYPNDVDQLSEIDFYQQFEKKIAKGKGDERWKELLEKAWKVRDFEIELYWKRANYFWLFQLPAFTAYFTLASKVSESQRLPDEVLVITCLGIVFSTAWFLINIGSKSWQRHWEVYIDLFEDKYYGPLYQTINSPKTFSVSKINEVVSLSFIFVWILFAFKTISFNKYFIDSDCGIECFNPVVAYSITFTILILIAMFFGYGRGYFKDREVKMFKRKYHYEDN
ncbi:hypothetical protein BC343_22050 [Mucilaginibacter pedocola]|uniref:Uncharacterized protein n=2 Tax=Mucilaginibacter pedocola TaxID=1792845 RepID=A0A1S9PJL7_9SPHI|nr:hypothetical protein BC343_22050 [Mucilaginibacter pedocola]